MVPEHDDDGGLLLLLEILHQGAEGLVRLIGQGEVLLRHGVPAGRIGEGHLGRVVLHRVATMVLNGDVEQEEGLSLLLVLKLPDNLVKIRLVTHIPVLKGLGHIHAIAVFVVVKAQIGIGPVPLPGGLLPGVEGQGIVAQLLQVGGQGGGGTQYVLLVGNAARGQEGHGIPG